MANSPIAFSIFAFTIGTSLFALFFEPDMFRAFLLHPYSFVRERRYFTVITSGLIHADLGHLLFNMITFYYFAFPLEPMIGRWPFLALYVISLVTSDISTIVKHRNDPNYYCLGASGAVTAVLFSFIIYRPTSFVYLMFIPVPIPAPLFAVLYILFSIYAARSARGRINHEAHLWGAASGLLITLVVAPRAYVRFFEAIGELV